MLAMHAEEAFERVILRGCRRSRVERAYRGLGAGAGRTSNGQCWFMNNPGLKELSALIDFDGSV